ncbi:MAG: EI24 domain-containing protein, partial [Saprospiraceae bacterium]
LIDTDLGWVSSVSSFVVRALLMIFFFIIYKYFVLIATSPLLSKLSEDIESNLDGDYISIPFSFKKAIVDFIRAIRLSLRNVSKELLYTILIFLVGLFPIFTIATTPFIFLVQSYFAGFGNMDFYLERYYNPNETTNFVKSNKAFAAGNGTPYMILMAIPVIGVFFAPVLGATAATLEVHKRMKNI